jgi:hypothetical protein
MLTPKFLGELHKLNRTEKLRVVQILVNELAVEEGASLASELEYPIYTPFGNEAAAQILFEVLQGSQNHPLISYLTL